MTTEKPPVEIYYNVSQTQLSVARYAGGARINGHEYTYNPKNEEESEMTTEKMPDVIWASRRPQDVGDRWTGPYKSYDDQTKFFRAKPVKELLKQARDALEEVSAHDAVILAMGTTIYKKLGLARVAIDKFLGEK